MKTLKPKSNWIKFNTHRAQILLSHHHSSNPTVKTNTQKRAKFRINRTKNCRNNLPHLNFQPKSHLSKKTRPNFSRQIRNSETGMNSNSLSSSLSHRESENFEFFFFLFLRMCGNWNSAFPCFYGILNSQGCEEYAEREREREREKESLECFSWNSFGSFTSNKSLINFPNNPFALNLHKRNTRCVMRGRENDLLTHVKVGSRWRTN